MFRLFFTGNKFLYVLILCLNKNQPLQVDTIRFCGQTEILLGSAFTRTVLYGCFGTGIIVTEKLFQAYLS